jgi:hypothetical protein
LINNLSNAKIINNQIQADKALLATINVLWDKFKDLPDFKIERFIIDNELNTVKIALLDGPQIYFNSSGDIDKQINKLQIIKTERLKLDFNKKQYLDLRIGDAVYYR